MPQAGFEAAIPANQVAAGKKYIAPEKMEKSKWIYYIFISAGMTFKNKKVPVLYTGIY
jgi:hypothetical protein